MIYKMILKATFSLALLAGALHAGEVPKVPEQPKWTKDNAVTYGKEIAYYSDKYEQGWKDEVGQGHMTLYDADGDSVRRSYSRMVLEQPEKGDKLIFKFISPAEIKGVAVLTFENPGSSDDSWLYLPSNKRVRRVSGANNTASFQGTEFTYEDLSNLDPKEYKWQFLEETELEIKKVKVKESEKETEKIKVYKLSAKPTYKNTGYSRLILYINTETWRQEQVDYFDKSGRHVKTKVNKEWVQFHKRFWRPKVIMMKNLLTGKHTKIESKKTYVDLSQYKSKKTKKNRKNLTEKMFSTRAIQK
jgi:hypothetical protein